MVKATIPSLFQLKSHTLWIKPACPILSTLHLTKLLRSANLMLHWFSHSQNKWQLIWGMKEETEPAKQPGWLDHNKQGLEWNCLTKSWEGIWILFQSIMKVIWYGSNMIWLTLGWEWWRVFSENCCTLSVFILWSLFSFFWYMTRCFEVLLLLLFCFLFYCIFLNWTVYIQNWSLLIVTLKFQKNYTVILLEETR